MSNAAVAVNFGMFFRLEISSKRPEHLVLVPYPRRVYIIIFSAVPRPVSLVGGGRALILFLFFFSTEKLLALITL